MCIEQVKKKLSKLSKKSIKYSQHANFNIVLRGGNKTDIIKNLLNPEKLIDCENQGKGKYKLCFHISNSKTMILIVKLKEKNLYIITFIMRHRAWKKKLEKRYGKKWKK